MQRAWIWSLVRKVSHATQCGQKGKNGQVGGTVHNQAWSCFCFLFPSFCFQPGTWMRQLWLQQPSWTTRWSREWRPQAHNDGAERQKGAVFLTTLWRHHPSSARGHLLCVREIIFYLSKPLLNVSVSPLPCILVLSLFVLCPISLTSHWIKNLTDSYVN